MLAHGLNGLALLKVDDPAGNGQDTSEVVFYDETGKLVHSGAYVGVHGGGPKNFRVLIGNANTATTGTFDTDPVTQRIAVVQL
jgi:hypothetical protein